MSDELRGRPKLDPVLAGIQHRVDPPKELVRALSAGERPCGPGRFVFTWQRGERKGLPVTVYCAEPLCLDTGECTGPRFVPHGDQFDSAPNNPRRRRRHVDLREAVEASKVASHMARHQTGRGDDRTDEEIASQIEQHRIMVKREQEGGGSWSPI